MNLKTFLVIITITFIPALQNVYCQNDNDLSFANTVSGNSGNLPAGYVPPLISNGSLSMLVDYQGCQFQDKYGGMVPAIWWAGRRYGPPNDQLVPYGHFDQELIVDGTRYTTPSNWTQTLNTKEAVVTCRADYGKLSVETIVFTPLSHDMIVIKKRFSAKAPGICSTRIIFKYQFTQPGNDNQAPRRTTIVPSWDANEKIMNLRYSADGYRIYNGIISLFCDKPVTAANDLQVITMSNDLTLSSKQTYEMTYYLLFADSMDGEDYPERAKLMKVKGAEGWFRQYPGFT